MIDKIRRTSMLSVSRDAPAGSDRTEGMSVPNVVLLMPNQMLKRRNR